jgi:4-hydroxy-tetrahydrodipicolinate synthase
MNKLYGTGVALVTPFDKSGEVDFISLKKILAHTANGVDYYVVMGTTGEAATMTRDEKKKVLDFVKENNTNNLPIVFGLGGNNTREVLEIIAHTDLSGVEAILSVSPYYSKPSQEGIAQHFIAVADASPVPVILYNVPARTASNLSADTTLRLAQHKKIVGIKEASGSLEQCMRIAQQKPNDFMLISGDDLLTLPMYAIGGVGVISVLANAFPVIFKTMKDHVLAGDYAKAGTEQFKLLEINGPMYEEGNPVGVKEVMAQMGICSNVVRLPLVPASPVLKIKIKAILEKQ